MAEQPRIATESLEGRRPYQEDAVLNTTLSDGRVLVAVADGMGGHAAGEVASALALETLVESLEHGQDLAQAFELANTRVHAKAREPGKQGMGTTLVAMLVEGDSYRVGNVGDSRGYLVTGEGIRQITEDHSFVAEAVKRGQSEEEAASSQWKDALTRGVGIDEQVEVDVFGPFAVEKNTAVLLCSDGLYKTLSDEDLRDIFARSGGPRGATQSLAATSFERGSDDNISVVVAEFGEVPRERPTGTMPLEFEPPPQADAPVTESEPTAGRADTALAAAAHGGLPIGVIAAVVVIVIVIAGVAYLLLGR